MNKEHESALTIPCAKVGDYYFPNYALPPDAGDIGFWGRRRREFLREHRPITFNQLVLSGELFKYGNLMYRSREIIHTEPLFSFFLFWKHST